ncbi:MAG: phenylalanine--tRNA ligase subunit beta [Gemmatimonadetes bacterium]|nr:MAG: phenylalanine--tRNA ligase subunit beta [Gemmatimonadota bacterium]
MIVSRRWLEALLGRPLDPRELEQRLAQLGVPVEAIVPLHQDLGDILVAQVLEVQKHPNADRLTVCSVDRGGGGGGGSPVAVVCGAPNVQAGKKYPYAPVGAVLPGGLKLERKKIRGVESNGMLCSAKELGLGEDHAGILELDTPAAPGTRLLDAVPLADHQLVLEVTANRPDLLCHKGVARELAAVLGGTVKLPPIPGAKSLSDRPPVRQSDRGEVDGVELRLEDTEGCPRYIAAVIRGVRVGASPAWLAERLRAVGQRPINNVVDATNYILFELNQPLHAFDLRKLRGPAVVIRRARSGERIVTLDGVPRTLTADMTAISDAERPTIVAGVMGSADSEVSEATTDLVLECAYFQPTRIRRTRRALDLSSESSYRFERGIDLLGMPDAMRRAIELILAVAGGELREPPLDLWPRPEQPRAVFLRPARVAHLLGTEIPRAEIERLLSSVGFVAAPKDERLAVQVPGWRPDVTRDVDLIEEVARLRGYDSFPDELRRYRPGTVPDAPEERAKARVRAALAGAGLFEARTMSLGPADGPEAVAVLNPLSAEEAHLRVRILPGLVRRVQHNWAGSVRDVRLFEVGAVFRAGTGAPEESLSVAGVLTGARRPPHWSEGAKVPDMDIWDLKHHFELAVGVAAPGSQLRPGADGAGWDAAAGAGQVVGWGGAIDVDIPKWAAPVYGFEVRLVVGAAKLVAYRPVPVTPPVTVDLALVLPAGVSAGVVESVLRREAGPLLERLEIFDEYRGAGVPAGARSVAWHCVFRDPARTLRVEDVERPLAKALGALEGELDVRRRES